MRIPVLDGIRGIAILLVLFAHLGMIAGYSALWAGTLGVNVFFVLSGFLITRILLKNESLVKFYKRRALRIWPLYYGFMGMALLIFGWHGWSYLFLCQNIVPHPETVFSNVTAQTWSLCVEEHFYLLWPALLRYLPKSIMIGLLCLTSIYLPPKTAATWWHLAPISWGCLLAMTFGDLVIDAIEMYRWLATPWLVFTGRISYALYLFHYPIFIGLQSHVFALEPILGKVFIAIALSFLLAEMSWDYFEYPILSR